MQDISYVTNVGVLTHRLTTADLTQRLLGFLSPRVHPLLMDWLDNACSGHATQQSWGNQTFWLSSNGPILNWGGGVQGGCRGGRKILQTLSHEKETRLFSAFCIPAPDPLLSEGLFLCVSAPCVFPRPNKCLSSTADSCPCCYLLSFWLSLPFHSLTGRENEPGNLTKTSRLYHLKKKKKLISMFLAICTGWRRCENSIFLNSKPFIFGTQITNSQPDPVWERLLNFKIKC
jgi:hypothetical protein